MAGNLDFPSILISWALGDHAGRKPLIRYSMPLKDIFPILQRYANPPDPPLNLGRKSKIKRDIGDPTGNKNNKIASSTGDGIGV